MVKLPTVFQSCMDKAAINNCVRVRSASNCVHEGGEYFEVCYGRTSKGTCALYDEVDGTLILCSLCVKFNGCNKETYKAWSGKTHDYQYFEEDGTPKQ